MLREKSDLQTFREALAVLQRQVDDLDELKVRHYQEIVEHEEEVWDFVQGKVCLVVRSTMDVFDRVTSKAYVPVLRGFASTNANANPPCSSDPVIEPMLQTIPDPFDSYGPPPAEDQIFSILPPLSVIANSSSAPSPLTASTPELESSDGLPSGKNSWSSAGGFFPDAAAAWADVPSSPPTGSPTDSGATSPARSISPSNVPKATSPLGGSRRHSHPASTSFAHHSRKSESKLRSVLSVLEEGSGAARSRQNGDADDSHARSVSADSGVSVSSANGKAPDLGGADASVWGGMSAQLAGLDVPSGSGEEETTPRNTLRVRAQSPATPTFDGTPYAERSRSPQSDDTATISSLPVASS